MAELRNWQPGWIDRARYTAQGMLAPLFGGDERAAMAYVDDKVKPTLEYMPGVGDAMAAAEARDEFAKGNYGMGGLLAAGAMAGLVPGVGDALQKGMKKGAKALSEKDFYRQYMAHKDIRNKGATKQQIQQEGFKPRGNVNALPPYRGGEPASPAQGRFAPKKGDVFYLAPKGAWKDKANGPQIVQGWKPEDYEVVTIEYDNQPLYEAYMNALGLLGAGSKK